MTDPIPVDATAAAVNSPGGLLRQAREARGVHIATLAASIKVAPSRLEALEADDYSAMPDTTFARALAQAVCRALKIESAPVLALMPESFHSRLERVDEGINAPFRDRPGGMLPDMADGVTGWPLLVGVVLLLLVGAAAFVWWPGRSVLTEAPLFPPGAESAASDAMRSQPVTPHGDTADQVALAAASAAPLDAPLGTAGNAVDTIAIGTSALGGQAASAAGAALASAASAAQAAVGAMGGAAGQALPAAAAIPASGAGAAPSALPAAPVDASQALVLRGLQDTWVQVTDGQGRVLVARTLAAGETLPLSGPEPLRLRIGNVKGTEVRYRGQVIAVPSSDNTARLSLPQAN